ncbi:molybdopterin-dependent oxidoreductase [uncultured Arcticibacterium sp.]|uniref:molybdopterin-dependent oxidoreductase n=1 Tax=uncultured Arcticibacterium sp. TaxID=2173042 RepID=UPI0030FA56A0
MQHFHYRTCNLCEAMCGLKITHENQEIIKIEGDKKDTFSRGHICPKAYGLKEIYQDPDRLKTPLKKVNGAWEAISWEAAYKEIASKIVELNIKHGPDSIAVYQGNPTIHNLGTVLTAPRFFKALKTKNIYSASSSDQIPHHFASWQMFGHPMLVPITDIDNTELFVIAGGNPLVSNGSMMTVPDIGNRLKSISERGGKVIVIDPRYTETAAKADQHIFIKPGTDAWLFTAILKHIFDENLVNMAHLEGFTDGLYELKAAIADFDIATAEEKTGIDQNAIKTLAKQIATTKKAALYGRMGVSTQAFGGLNNWLINAINIVSGNLDLEGGLLFTKPLIDFIGKAKPKNRYNRWQSRVRKFPEFLGELPVACLSEEIETEGKGQIKMLMTSCGNPVLSITNGNRLDAALKTLDYMVSFDIYLNETTKHADIILPPATGLEVPHYDLTFNVLAVRNTAKYSPALFEKEKEAKYDWEIFQELGHALAKAAGVEPSNGGKVYSPEEMLSISLKNNDYNISFKDLQEQTHGFDLGSLKPQLPARLGNENKRINLCPELLVNDLKRLKEATDEKGYTLIGKRHLRDNNSWMHNSDLLQKGKNRCLVLMNPADGKKEGIKTGDKVAVKSRVGEVKIEAHLTTDIMPGVLVIPHGYGHGKGNIKLTVAERNPGVSANDLTDDMLIDQLTGNAAFSNVRVQISAVA